MKLNKHTSVLAAVTVFITLAGLTSGLYDYIDGAPAIKIIANTLAGLCTGIGVGLLISFIILMDD